MTQFFHFFKSIYFLEFIGFLAVWEKGYGVSFLFAYVQEPNHADPLNHDAAAVLRDNPKAFQSNVKKAMLGGVVGQTNFSRCV